jgi:hypothetical protein
MSKNDDFVEDLFRDLPKSKQISEIELKRHEKLILQHIEEMKLERAKKHSSVYGRFQRQFQLAAAFLVAVAGIGFVINQNSTTGKSELEIAIAKPSPADQTDNNLPSKDSGGSSGSTESGSDNDQFEVIEPAKNKYLYSTGLDYETQLTEIKSKIKLSPTPIEISTLAAAYGKCAIELGINEQLQAIDKGSYQGEEVLAFFYEGSSANSNIWIVSKSCKKIAKI